MEQSDLVRQAARQAAEGYDFADALISLGAKERGCEYTATFDARAVQGRG
ncbi:hypothetical protein [Arthrobacter pigmenti]|nr:hypothetical protein [Arthrobacter pigmenti]